METQEILEGNKIIARFMGLPEYKIEFKGKFLNFENSKHNRYNSDWNILMSVVEKIESLGFTCFIQGNECSIESLEKTIGTFCRTTKIEAVYKAVIEFIKLYNQNEHRTINNT